MGLAEWIAIAAVVVAVAAVALAAVAFSKVTAVRRSQDVLLGGNAKADVVEFAVSLQARIDDLHRAVDEVAAALARVDRRVDGALSRSALIRYDAYEDTGGHQSASMAHPRLRAIGDRPDRDPGPRLRARLREAARPGPHADRAVAGGAAGGRTRDGR